MATQKRTMYENAMRELPPTIKSLSEKYDIPVVSVDNVNNEKSQKIIEEANPEIILLGNTRIIKPHIFNIASHGCLNVQEYCRGSKGPFRLFGLSFGTSL